MSEGAVAALAVTLALALTSAAAAAGQAPGGDPAAVLPAAAALAPLVRAERIERHTAEDLWERIDGEAELYRSFGLTASAHALYEDPGTPDRRIDLSVFALADPLAAFGLFAAFRASECPAQPLGNGGCLGDYQGFFWQGRLFVLADAAGPDAARSGDLRRALEAAAASLGPAPPRPEPLRAFSRFAETRTIRYQPQHLLGRAALPPGLEGLAAGIPVFLATGPGDSGGPAATLDAYALVLEGAERGERNGHRVLTGRDPALGPVVLVGDSAGIAGARPPAGATGLTELLEAILEHRGDPLQEGPW